VTKLDPSDHSREPKRTEPCGDVGFCVVSVRVLEIVDASVGPGQHDRRVRLVRNKLGQPPDDEARVIPFVVPTDHNGGVAGVALRF
jgi:hypothetical protein